MAAREGIVVLIITADRCAEFFGKGLGGGDTAGKDHSGAVEDYGKLRLGKQ